MFFGQPRNAPASWGAPGEEGRHGPAKPPRNKRLRPGSQAGGDLLGQHHFCNREHDCAQTPRQQTHSAAEHRSAGDPGEVTPRAEGCSRSPVPVSFLSPPQTHRHRTETCRNTARLLHAEGGSERQQGSSGLHGCCGHAGGDGA